MFTKNPPRTSVCSAKPRGLEASCTVRFNRRSRRVRRCEESHVTGVRCWCWGRIGRWGHLKMRLSWGSLEGFWPPPHVTLTIPSSTQIYWLPGCVLSIPSRFSLRVPRLVVWYRLDWAEICSDWRPQAKARIPIPQGWVEPGGGLFIATSARSRAFHAHGPSSVEPQRASEQNDPKNKPGCLTGFTVDRCLRSFTHPMVHPMLHPIWRQELIDLMFCAFGPQVMSRCVVSRRLRKKSLGLRYAAGPVLIPCNAYFMQTPENVLHSLRVSFVEKKVLALLQET